MTSASKGRVARRATKLAAQAQAYTPGEAPKAIITITEIPGTGGGFTLGLGLHGARMEEIDPGKQHPVSIVDIIALAAVTTIRQQPKDFQDCVSLVNSTLQNVKSRIEDGESPEVAVADADAALDGAISDVEPVAEEVVAANAG